MINKIVNSNQSEIADEKHNKNNFQIALDFDNVGHANKHIYFIKHALTLTASYINPQNLNYMSLFETRFQKYLPANILINLIEIRNNASMPRFNLFNENNTNGRLPYRIRGINFINLFVSTVDCENCPVNGYFISNFVHNYSNSYVRFNYSRAVIIGQAKFIINHLTCNNLLASPNMHWIYS